MTFIRQALPRFGTAMLVLGFSVGWLSFLWPGSNQAWQAGVAAMLIGAGVLGITTFGPPELSSSATSAAAATARYAAAMAPPVDPIERRLSTVKERYARDDITFEEFDRYTDLILGNPTTWEGAAQRVDGAQDYQVFEPVVLVDGTGEVVDVIPADTKTIKGRDVVVTDGVAHLEDDVASEIKQAMMAPITDGASIVPLVTGGCDMIVATTPDAKPEEEQT